MVIFKGKLDKFILHALLSNMEQLSIFFPYIYIYIYIQKQKHTKERLNDQTNKLVIIETNTQTNVINN